MLKRDNSKLEYIDDSTSQQFVALHVIGFALLDVPSIQLEFLENSVEKICNDKESIPYNSYLAGHIEKEYAFTEEIPDSFNKFINKTSKKYFTDLGIPHFAEREYSLAKSEVKYKNKPLPDMWVNVQKKGEHNPVHHHDGTLSFVIWLKVPFTMEEERGVPGGRNNRFVNGGFEFFYPTNHHPSGIMNFPLPVDKTFEGKMVIFPSWLNHTVSPFYSSDDYRISVAGNIQPTGTSNTLKKSPEIITI